MERWHRRQHLFERATNRLHPSAELRVDPERQRIGLLEGRSGNDGGVAPDPYRIQPRPSAVHESSALSSAIDWRRGIPDDVLDLCRTAREVYAT